MFQMSRQLCSMYLFRDQVLPKSLFCHPYGPILIPMVKVGMYWVPPYRKQEEHEGVLCPRAKCVTQHFHGQTICPLATTNSKADLEI